MSHETRRSGTHYNVTRATAFAGTMRFVYIHSVWFGLWIAINLGGFKRS